MRAQPAHICRLIAAFMLLTIAFSPAPARAASGAGIVRGHINGPDGLPMAAVPVLLRNDITGFSAGTTTTSDGAFSFFNVPFNPYELHVELSGYASVHQAVDVRSGSPVELSVALRLPSLTETVNVTAEATAGQLETDSSTSHVDVDKSYIARAAATTASRAMEELITASPGFAKDENGRFHFQGFHSQAQYVVDGQTISDQTGVTFSNSIDPGIAQSVEVIYGNMPAEYGEKVGAVINLATRSGLATPLHGSIYGGAARYATYEGGLALGGGSSRFGAFGSVDGTWSDRFLDPVNPDNLANQGNTQRGFGRLDFASDGFRDLVRLTALVGRTRRGVPNTYTQEAAGQDEEVRSRDLNVSLGWTRAHSARSSLETNAFMRLSRFDLAPSPNDTPVQALSERSLDNYGLNATLTWTPDAHHEIKAGGVVKRFPIGEHFRFALTDPALNDPESPDFNPDLAPYDLTRGGSAFDFQGRRTGTYAGAFIQDTLHVGGLTANLGARFDRADLPTAESLLQPRLGLAYYVKTTGTVLRASYNRLFITPEYENILFGSSSEAAGLVPPVVKDARELGGGVLLNRSERQHAYTLGAQQAIGHRLRFDVDVWWRRATNPGDQDQFANTGIVFPITFTSGRHNGWDARIDLAQTHGVRGFLSLGHTHAVYVPPPVGGLFLDQGAIDAISGGPFLIDHDQKLQAQGNILWDVARTGVWMGVNVRYDSGLVTDASPDELAEDPDNAFAAPFVVVHSGADLDPNRIKARTVTNLSLGWEPHRLPVSIQADLLNAFDTPGVYNILSVFGGTHVIPPRTLSVRLRYALGHKSS